MVYTAEQMRIVEAKSVEIGLSWLRLIENAGSAATRIIRDNYKLKNKKVVIICGKGNNGGDGYVIARKLTEDDAVIRVIAVGKSSTASSIEMVSKASDKGIKPIDFDSYSELCRQYILDADIIIDALFGIGFKGEADGVFADVISTVNQSEAETVAVDIPSGMVSDECTAQGPCVRADMTITFTGYKLCQVLYPSANLCGRIIVASIGMPDEALNSVEPAMRVVSEADVARALPVRTRDFHKGDCGTAGLLCGSRGMAGAAVIAAKACIKSGVGIANVIVPKSIYNIVGVSIPEAVCTVLENVEDDRICSAVTDEVISSLDKCDVALVGCGLGQSKQARYTLQQIMKNCSIPLILDADGINIMSDSIDLIKQYTNEVIITPHPKEASRLLGCSVEEVQHNRLNSAKRLADITDAVVVLKGSNTLIALPDGAVFVVTDGNPGMATAGTGDMLAGMIAAFVSQGLTAADAAVCAVKIHAMAGDEAVKETSVLSLTPTDMINTLPTVYCRMYLKK